MVWGALGLEEFAPLYSVVVKQTKKQEISQTHLWLCVWLCVWASQETIRP